MTDQATDRAYAERPADAMVVSNTVILGAPRALIDLQAQLVRDARSLQLTMEGSENQSDRRFYQAVITNMEEAAKRLAEIPQLVTSAADQSARRYDEGRIEGYGAALQFALGVRDPMPVMPGAPKAWRDACNAMINGVRAMRDALVASTYPKDGAQ